MGLENESLAAGYYKMLFICTGLWIGAFREGMVNAENKKKGVEGVPDLVPT